MLKESIYNYNNCINVLIGEIKRYNQNNEAKKKKLKKRDQLTQMSKFILYINSLNRTFIGSKMKLLWGKNKITKNFITLIKNYSFDDIIPLMIEILCGNFSKTKKKFIADTNNKPIIFYLIPFNKNKSILFSICIRADINNKNIGYEYIYFISICEENEFKIDSEDFINKLNKEENPKCHLIE